MQESKRRTRRDTFIRYIEEQARSCKLHLYNTWDNDKRRWILRSAFTFIRDPRARNESNVKLVRGGSSSNGFSGTVPVLLELPLGITLKITNTMDVENSNNSNNFMPGGLQLGKSPRIAYLQLHNKCYVLKYHFKNLKQTLLQKPNQSPTNTNGDLTLCVLKCTFQTYEVWRIEERKLEMESSVTLGQIAIALKLTQPLQKVSEIAYVVCIIFPETNLCV
ncbi:hypothetical protein WN51_02610 [Melipona quadrifasciata]|uniref:Uncharacterized protein n=1 Tax=Melipona quadrifasciata TaxID=166423 RepID=A0A0N0BDJ5_9HYME|nr:hypothetical protein WN51_02610 [Melipona quadrifasciata]